MTIGNVRERVQAVFRRVLKDDAVELYDEMTADDHAAWDSLSHIHLMMDVESEFGIRLKNSEVARLRNVRDLLTLVESKTS